MVLTADLSERPAEYVEDSANSSDSEGDFLHFPNHFGQKLKKLEMLQLLKLQQDGFFNIYND